MGCSFAGTVFCPESKLSLPLLHTEPVVARLTLMETERWSLAMKPSGDFQIIIYNQGLEQLNAELFTLPVNYVFLSICREQVSQMFT